MHSSLQNRSGIQQSNSAGRMLEPLEKRLHLAATLGGETLNVTGTNGADTIAISRDPKNAQNYLVTINETTSSFSASAVRTIKVQGKSGADRIVISDRQGKVDAMVVINGGNGHDTLTGGAGADLIMGGAGNDVINGGAGHDCLYGDSGNDTISGGRGNDVLGGDDEDLMRFKGKRAARDVAGNDLLWGAAGNDWLLGGTGNAVINDASGMDTLYGGKGRDIIDVRGEAIVMGTNRQDWIPARQFEPVSQNPTVHTHVSLQILVRTGRRRYQEVVIPDGVGFFGDNLAALHTHDETGLLHFEPNTERSYQLSELFRLWGVSIGSNHLGRYMLNPDTPIQMTVNGVANDQLEKYQPQDGDEIVITIG